MATIDSNYSDWDYKFLLCDVCKRCNLSFYNDSYSNEWNYNYTDDIKAAFKNHYCPDFYNDSDVGHVGRILISISLTITVLLSVLGNTLAICILAFANRVRTNFNSFLINLAVADLVMAIVCIPFTALNSIIGWWPFGGFACAFIVYMQQVSVTVSIYTLMAIGIDRYIGVVHPLRKNIPALKHGIVIAVIWVVSMTMSTAQLVTARRLPYLTKYREVHYVCDEQWENQLDQTIYELFVIVVIYIIPLCAISYCYFNVVKVIWARKLPGNKDKVRDHRHAKSKRKVAKMLVSIVMVFAICWIPLHTLILVTTIRPDLLTNGGEVILKIYFVFYWLAMSNTFVNPFIYTVCHDGFRADLRNVCTLCRRSCASCMSSINSTTLFGATREMMRSRSSTQSSRSTRSTRSSRSTIGGR
ncbi:QRFP-like peptide receptor [Glandiceps talaboti]